MLNDTLSAYDTDTIVDDLISDGDTCDSTQAYFNYLIAFYSGLIPAKVLA